MSHSVVWVDIPVTDLERALRFYSAMLGKKVEKGGGPGFSFGIFPHQGEDVGGCLVPPGDGNAPSQQGPLLYFNASGRLREAVEAATANGGRVVNPITQIGPHGHRAIIVDSEGNRLALHSQTV